MGRMLRIAQLRAGVLAETRTRSAPYQREQVLLARAPGRSASRRSVPNILAPHALGAQRIHAALRLGTECG